MPFSFLKNYFSFPSDSQRLRKEGALNKSSLRSSAMAHLSMASTRGSLTNKASVLNSGGHLSESSKMRVFLDSQDSGHILQRISEINHDNILPIKDPQVSHNHASFTTVIIKTSLLDLIKRYREEEQYIPREILLRYCSELTNGFQHLNEMLPDLGYLDPKSILIDQSDHIRIAGFGDFKFVYEKSESSLRFESSQVSSVLKSISKRDPRCQGWNLGAIIAGLCTLKPRLMSNIKLYGENRKKFIKKKLKNIDVLYGKDFLKLIFHLFDPDISKSDAINQLKDALSLISPPGHFDSRSINQKQETEEQKIIEVSDSRSNSLQSLEESINRIPAEHSENTQNANEIQAPRSIPSGLEVVSGPIETPVFEERLQDPHPLPLCESILDYQPRDRFGFPAWKFEISYIPIEHESILGYVPQNLLPNTLEQQTHDEVAQNEEQRNSASPRLEETMNIECLSLSTSQIHHKSSSWEGIKEGPDSSQRSQELAFSNEVSVITIGVLEDFHEENLEIKRLLKFMDPEDFIEDNLTNLIYEALAEQRRNLIRISRVQIRDVLGTVLKMISNEQISLYELFNNPFLNSQAILPEVPEDRKEELKGSLVNYKLLEKGLNLSPVSSSFGSDGETSKDADQENFLSKHLIGKEESNKKPLPSRLCRSSKSEKSQEV